MNKQSSRLWQHTDGDDDLAVLVDHGPTFPHDERYVLRANTYLDEGARRSLARQLVATFPDGATVDRAVLVAPDKPGMVAYEVEIVPHNCGSDGMGWEKGVGTPAEVARALRHYAEQAESFTPPEPELLTSDTELIDGMQVRTPGAAVYTYRKCWYVWQDEDGATFGTPYLIEARAAVVR